MKRFFLMVLLVVLLAGCAGSRSKKTGVTRMVNTSALEADLAFARLAMQVPPAEAFARYTDARSMELPPAGPPVVGQPAISAGLERVTGAQYGRAHRPARAASADRATLVCQLWYDCGASAGVAPRRAR